MKKKLSTAKIVAAVNILGAKDTKLGKMNESDQFAVVRTLCGAKPVAEAFEKYVADARERLKPENFAEIQEKYQKFDTLADEEKRKLNKQIADYENAVSRCVADELASEKEVTVHTINDGAFIKFLASNPDMSINDKAVVAEFMQK